jgi:hypothetical protein
MRFTQFQSTNFQALGHQPQSLITQQPAVSGGDPSEAAHIQSTNVISLI